MSERARASATSNLANLIGGVRASNTHRRAVVRHNAHQREVTEDPKQLTQKKKKEKKKKKKKERKERTRNFARRFTIARRAFPWPCEVHHGLPWTSR